MPVNSSVHEAEDPTFRVCMKGRFCSEVFPGAAYVLKDLNLRSIYSSPVFCSGAVGGYSQVG